MTLPWPTMRFLVRGIPVHRIPALCAGIPGLRLLACIRATALVVIATCVLGLASGSAMAQVADNTAPLEFRDASEEARFHALAAELRCVMCQNQSLADSNAQIARDLRAEVLQLMRQGKSDTEVKQFLVARYGEFVLYRPQVESSTWLLWFGPALLVVIGGFIVARLVRKRSRVDGTAHGSANDDGQEQEW